MSNAPVVDIAIRNPYGVVAANVNDYLYFQGTLIANTIGRTTLIVSGDFPRDLIRRGMWLDVWWAPYPGFTLRPWRCYELQKPTYIDDEKGLRTWKVEGMDLKSILQKRRIRADKGSTQADKQGPVETVMKSYVTDHKRTLTTAYGLTVAPNHGRGPVIKKEAGRGNLYTVLQDLAKAAAEADNAALVYFDVLEQYTAEGLTTLFQVWMGELGVNQAESSPSPLILSKSTGTITKLEYVEDGEKEVNRVDVGGKSDSTGRAVVTVEDSLRANAFPGALVEGWTEKSDTSDNVTLQNVGYKVLRENNVVRKVTVTFADSLAVRIGRDINHGDRCLVHIEQLDRLLPARLTSLVLTSEKGRVTIQGTLDVFEVIDGT